MILNKQEVLSKTPSLKEVEIPEWGGSVYIRPITLAEQAKLADLGVKFEKALVAAKMKGVMLPLIQWAVVDAHGDQFFNAADLDALMNLPASSVLRLQDEILAYSGLTKESREELEKNLLNTPNEEPVSP